MTVSHCITSIDTTTGGPARSVTHLITSLAHLDATLQLQLHIGISNDPVFTSFSLKNVWLQFYKYRWFGGFKHFRSSLRGSQPNILHGHGLWQLPVHQMVSYAQEKGLPYIMTPRGMLEPWSLAQSPLKKQLAMVLYQRKDLVRATCLHATAQMEAENIRALGFKNPIAVIPNGIDLSEFPLKLRSENNGQRTLLFLSRIHPKKGIELLVEAWSQLDRTLRADWKVEIAGNGEEAYIQTIQQLIKNKGLASEIHIIGPQFGAAKLAAYYRADVFVLPTYSENFGIVVAEALACGIPVITTQGAPWQDLETHGCGWWIPTGVEALTQTLAIAMSLPPAQLAQMGAKGRQLVEEKYSMEAVAAQMLQLYQWLLGKGDRPEFVYLN